MNNFVVSFSFPQHRVCIVDGSGRVLYSYGGPHGSGDGQLNCPLQLTVDKFDNVLVADHGNNRIVLLSPTLSLLGYIQTPGHQLNSPSALQFDARKRCLYIGQQDGNLIVLTVNVIDAA